MQASVRSFIVPRCSLALSSVNRQCQNERCVTGEPRWIFIANMCNWAFSCTAPDGLQFGAPVSSWVASIFAFSAVAIFALFAPHCLLSVLRVCLLFAQLTKTSTTTKNVLTHSFDECHVRIYFFSPLPTEPSRHTCTLSSWRRDALCDIRLSE